MTSQQVVSWVHKEVYNDSYTTDAKKKNPQQLSKSLTSLFDECCAKDLGSSQGIGTDNMTAILVEIRHDKK
jgi:serine/threonine protein phosphatase PrpC